MGPAAATEPPCPHCGAALEPGAHQCWLCLGLIEEPVLAEVVAEPAEPPRFVAPPPPPGLRPGQFGMLDLFLFITLAAVVLGTFLAAPGLGLLLVFLMGPAFVRAEYAGLLTRRAGLPVSRGAQWMNFAVSLGVMIAVSVAGSAAFVVLFLLACHYRGPIHGISQLLLVLAIGAPPLLAGGVIWLTRPRPPRSKNPPPA